METENYLKKLQTYRKPNNVYSFRSWGEGYLERAEKEEGGLKVSEKNGNNKKHGKDIKILERDSKL